MKTLLWLQGGACGGNTLSTLNAEDPDLLEFLELYDIKILWHPSLSLESGDDVKSLLNDILADRINLDILIFEGTVVLGPKGSGKFNMFASKPMKDWLKLLANKANYIIAIGDCASFGEVPASEPKSFRINWFTIS